MRNIFHDRKIHILIISVFDFGLKYSNTKNWKRFKTRKDLKKTSLQNLKDFTVMFIIFLIDLRLRNNKHFI